MKQLFNDFWRINLGHVAITALFLFGLGVSWSKQASRVDLLDQRETSRHETVLTKIETNVVSLALRLEATERWQKDAEIIVRAIESMRLEQKYTNEALKELKLEVKTMHEQLPYRRLGTNTKETP